MRDHQLLLRRLGQRRDTRRHDGRIAVDQSDVRWCSDGFEFRCDYGSPLRVTFALDCRDREAISRAATTGGHSGDVVRDVMLAAVEQRFGTTQTCAPIEWLSDNGSAYIDHRTRSFCSRAGSGAVDYTRSHKADVPTARLHLAGAFEHYNERHPHKALKYRSPESSGEPLDHQLNGVRAS
ncbi:IS3 family transposase ISButh1 [Paraburkholderia kirstenboschensis]|nr:IS3 family transposase ISButh1 [Paraburkholderia kirstenboschensis]